jgi:hypothetical protein
MAKAHHPLLATWHNGIIFVVPGQDIQHLDTLCMYVYTDGAK